MLTSIRSLLAASASVGVLLSAAPAFAKNTENTSTSEVNEAELVNVETVGVQSLKTDSASDTAEILIDPAADWSAQSLAVRRAAAPIGREGANALGGESGLTFSANAALATEYRFRGVNLSGGEIAIQGGFDVSHSSGLYAGTWASNLDEDTVGYGAVELDLYGGWSGQLVEGLSADIGFIAYTYPDAPEGDFDYYEFYGSLSFDLGPASTTVGVAYDPEQDGLDFGGLTRDNLYVFTDLAVGIPSTPITLNAHLGYTDGSLTFTNDSKSFDWSLGAELALGGNFTASVAYIDADGDIIAGQFNPTSSTIVGTISASF